MKSRKNLFAVLGAVGILGASVLPTFSAHAKANINSLDYVFSYGAINCFERDPSWSEEEYLIRYGREVIKEEGRYSDDFTADNAVMANIEADYNTFYSEIFAAYAETHIADFSTNLDYYTSFHTELRDDYLKSYYLFSAKASMEYANINNYDIIGNHCRNSGEYPLIPTTYDNDGYFGFLRMNGEEIELENEDTSFFGNGFSYKKDNFANLKVEFERIDATTLKVHYFLENLTGNAAEYGLAFYGDIEVGGNDNAAVSRTQDSFTITQDNDTNYSDTFGAQFKIQLDPLPTTTYVGNYSEAEKHRWENSGYNAFSAADSIDTGLSYSWQGTIAAGETKELSSTYYINLAEGIFKNNFYKQSGGSEPAYQIDAIDGLYVILPPNSPSSRKGYHYVWNTKSDGTGTSYEGSDVVKADRTNTNFYEIEVENRLVTYPTKIWSQVRESSLNIPDAFREKYNHLLSESYSDVIVYLGFDEDIEDLEDEIKDGNIDPAKVKEVLGKNYEPISIIESEDGYLGYLTEPDESSYNSIDFDESDYPLEVSLFIDENFKKDKANFSIARVKCGASIDTEWTCSEYEKIPTTYNYETGELILSYDGKRYEEGIDYYNEYLYVLAYTNVPGVPNAGISTSTPTLALIATNLSLPTFLVAFYALKRTIKG